MNANATACQAGVTRIAAGASGEVSGTTAQPAGTRGPVAGVGLVTDIDRTDHGPSRTAFSPADAVARAPLALSVAGCRLRVVYEQPSLLGAGAVGPSLWPGWLGDPDTRHRFEAKVHHRSPTACWYWTAAIGSDGHGRFRAGSRTTATSRVVAAHLYAYQLEHGLLADRPTSSIGLVVRHRCDEASCQNPAHLQLGTAADNVDDYRVRRWRHASPLGDARGAAERARAIRTAIRAAGPGQTEPAIAAAIAAGHDDDRQLVLAIPLPRRPSPGDRTVRWGLRPGPPGAQHARHGP